VKRILLQRVLPAAITIGLLALVFVWVEDPAEIPRQIAQVPWHIHVLFVLVTMISMLLRACRWRALLPNRNLTARQCVGPIFIGFMMNSLLPARAGEFARSIALSRKTKIPFASAFGSVVLERVFDGLFLLGSFVFVLGVMGVAMTEESVKFGEHEISGDLMETAAKSSSIIILVMLVGIVAILFPGPRRLAESVARAVLPERAGTVVVNQLEKLIQGFHALHSPRAIVSVVLWTLGIWVLVALSVWIGSFGFEEFEITYMQAWAIMVFICVAIMLPASPGYWGLYEVGVIVSFLALGIAADVENPRSVALSFSLVIHFWQYGPIVVTGLIFLWVEGLALAQLRKVEAAELPNDPEPPVPYGA
jgi:hypothetical protein